jgi:hypothetical protein
VGEEAEVISVLQEMPLQNDQKIGYLHAEVEKRNWERLPSSGRRKGVKKRIVIQAQLNRAWRAPDNTCAERRGCPGTFPRNLQACGMSAKLTFR